MEKKFLSFLSPEIIRKDMLAEKMAFSDYYDYLIDLKKKISENEVVDEEINGIRRDILESWIRSRNYGINRTNYLSSIIFLEDNQFELVLKRNKEFITASNEILRPMEGIMLNTKCLAFITDCNGVVLDVIGGIDKIKQEHMMVKAAIWREDTIGTCAHGICLVKKYPVQLWGPEHWCSTFNMSTGSAAPIFDSRNKLIGTLTIGSQLGNPQGIHTMALAIALAWAIQNKLFLLQKDHFLEKTLDAAEEAIILIDSNGIIIQENIRAMEFFRNSCNYCGHYYEDFFGKQPAILAAIKDKKESFNNEVIFGSDKRKFFYSVKPLGDNMGCILTLTRIKSNFRRSALRLDTSLKNRTFDDIIGDSIEIKTAISQAKKFAEIDNNILLMGESGVGKDIFAQAIHNASRKEEPYIAVNCAAIPRNLIESELLGYEGGTFTGADKGGRKGKIELADNGTLFLDEIGDMPLEVQPVLLRVLEDKQVIRLGSSNYIPVNFRLIAATNQNLRELVNKGKFRLDLYYRIAVFNIIIPPLRDRKVDILLLAEYFIKQYSQKQGMKPLMLSPATKIKFLNYSWPGNVRQLQNAIIYSIHNARNNIIELEDLPIEILEALPVENVNTAKPIYKYDYTLEGIEKMSIYETLKATNYNVRKTAEILGMSKSTLYRRIKQYGLKNN